MIFCGQARAGSGAVRRQRGRARPGRAGLPGLLVADTRLALQQLGQRLARPVQRCRWSAVTGSNGKTTVTQMIAAILRAWQPRRCARRPQGNLNNDIGVPLTAAAPAPTTQVAVLELGMNHPGEIAVLAAHGPTHGGAGQQRPARAPGVHGHGGCGGAARTARSSRRCPPTARRCSRHEDAYTPLWAELAGSRTVLQLRP
jgi:hypothetical protein